MAFAPGNLSSYNFAPGETPLMANARQRLALMLAGQGADTSPVQHPLQGAARVANAMVGNYILGEESRKDDAEKAEGRALVSRILAGGGAQLEASPTPVPAPIRSSPVVAARSGDVPAPARAEVQPTDKVWGDNEAEAAGIYEKPPAATFNNRFAATNDMRGGMAPNRKAEIATLLNNKFTAPLGQQMLVAEMQKEQNRVRPLTDTKERAAMGIAATDTNAYQVDAQGKIIPVNPQPFNVNVNQQAESEFSKKAGELQAKRFDDIAGEGVNAKQMQSDVSMLRDLGEKIRTGKVNEFKAVVGPYAEALGVNVKGLPEIQAFEAIVNRVAPQMRVKGTGAQSDFELRNFLKQFPSIGNNPDGNAIIDRTLQGFIQNKIAAAEIGSAALTGEITRKEAEKRLRDLPDPMKEWREFNKAQPSQNDNARLRKKYNLD